MTENRKLVMMAVLEGRLPADAVTMEEINETYELVLDLIAEKRNPHLPHHEYGLQ